MADESRGYLIRQYEMAWMLASYHLDGLATAECLWRPARAGLHVQQQPDGSWRAGWPILRSRASGCMGWRSV